MKSNLVIISTLINICLPIINNCVMFRSFGGQYNDNPKYISQKLHEKYPDIKIVWAIKDGKPEDFPEYVKLVNINSWDYIKYISRAEVVVDNYSGCRSYFATSKNILKRMAFSLVSYRRKKQLNVSTWHGTPLKHIAMDEPHYKKMAFCKPYLCANIIMSGNQLTSDAFKTALKWNGELSDYGMPRNDILFLPKDNKRKEKLGLPIDKKIILFAPTYRNDIDMSGISQLKSLEIDNLLDSLNKKFGGEWILVFRAHNLVMKEIEKSRGLFDSRIVNGNTHPDMAEYLSVTDVLLTDYSSSMFDFMFTNRPCFLLTPDLYEYKNNERGFYFDMDKLPFTFASTPAELIENIDKFDSDFYLNESERFLDFIKNYESGQASENIVEYIHDFMNRSK